MRTPRTDRQALVTGSQAAELVGIRPQTFYGWVRDGHVDPWHVDRVTGRRYYRVGDVLARAEATYRRRDAARRGVAA